VKKKWIAIATAMFIFTVVNVAYAADEITILVHGKKISSGAAKIENGTTLVPLRVIAENLDQNVQWDPKTKIVTIEQKEKQSDIERLVIQKKKDIFVMDGPEDLEENKASEALINNLQTLYNEAYRGFLSVDMAEPEIRTEDAMSFIKDSLTTKEGSVETSYNFVRLVQKPYIRQTGENAPSRKDIIFYIDSKNSKDLYMAVQNPEKLKEWGIYRLDDYGSWFLKEIDVYLWPSRGL